MTPEPDACPRCGSTDPAVRLGSMNFDEWLCDGEWHDRPTEADDPCPTCDGIDHGRPVTAVNPSWFLAAVEVTVRADGHGRWDVKRPDGFVIDTVTTEALTDLWHISHDRPTGVTVSDPCPKCGVPAPGHCDCDRPTGADDLARQFHDTYERLAPDYGYTTRPESAVPWEEVPENNRRLMVAVVDAVIGARLRELDTDRCTTCGSTDPAVRLPSTALMSPGPCHDRPTGADRLPLEGLTIDTEPDKYGLCGLRLPDGTLIGSYDRPSLLSHGVTIPDAAAAPEPERRLLQLWDGDCDVPNILLAVRSAGDLRPGDVVAGCTVGAITGNSHSGVEVEWSNGEADYYPPGVPVVLDKQADQ